MLRCFGGLIEFWHLTNTYIHVPSKHCSGAEKQSAPADEEEEGIRDRLYRSLGPRLPIGSHIEGRGSGGEGDICDSSVYCLARHTFQRCLLEEYMSVSIL